MGLARNSKPQRPVRTWMFYPRRRQRCKYLQAMVQKCKSVAKTPKKSTVQKNEAAQALSALRKNKLTPERRIEIASAAGKISAKKRRAQKLQNIKADSQLAAYVRGTAGI